MTTKKDKYVREEDFKKQKKPKTDKHDPARKNKKHYMKHSYEYI